MQDAVEYTMFSLCQGYKIRSNSLKFTRYISFAKITGLLYYCSDVLYIAMYAGSLHECLSVKLLTCIVGNRLNYMHVYIVLRVYRDPPNFYYVLLIVSIK